MSIRGTLARPPSAHLKRSRSGVLPADGFQRRNLGSKKRAEPPGPSLLDGRVRRVVEIDGPSVKEQLVDGSPKGRYICHDLEDRGLVVVDPGFPVDRICFPLHHET